MAYRIDYVDFSDKRKTNSGNKSKLSTKQKEEIK